MASFALLHARENQAIYEEAVFLNEVGKLFLVRR